MKGACPLCVSRCCVCESNESCEEGAMEIFFYILFAAILVGAIVWVVRGKRA